MQAHKQFRAKLAGIYDDGEVEAMWRILMEEWMHYTTVDIIMRAQSELPEVVEEKLVNAVERLLRHEPLQHIVGAARFHGHRLMVDASTLIPRPETEQLVDIIVQRHASQPDLRVLDVGTGSGCIAISLARALRFARVSAIDLSADALNVARRNACQLGCNISFEQTDILQAKPCSEAYDMIVSNPPYICPSEMAAMLPNVLDYEPHSALFVPQDKPLLFYSAIARYAISALAPGGWLYFEINPIYYKEVVAMLELCGFEQVTTERDLYGRMRFAWARKPERL
ncbi:MAG: peptide chain release factor N(5)-glutamine methyltransferase [Muribaculaceae bacterium]